MAGRLGAVTSAGREAVPAPGVAAVPYSVQVHALQVCADEADVTELFFASFVGNCEIDLEIKRYFCRAGVQSIQVRFFKFHRLLKFSMLYSERKW